MLKLIIKTTGQTINMNFAVLTAVTFLSLSGCDLVSGFSKDPLNHDDVLAELSSLKATVEQQQWKISHLEAKYQSQEQLLANVKPDCLVNSLEFTEAERTKDSLGGNLLNQESPQQPFARLPSSVQKEIEPAQVFPSIAHGNQANSLYAFSAYFTDEYIEYPPSATIAFKGVDLNYGNNYNPDTSLYTCPATGVYFFGLQISLIADSDADLYSNVAHIMNGDIIIANAYSYIAISNTYMASTYTSAVVQCAQGTTVYVKNNDYFVAEVYGHPLGKTTVFNGFLLSIV